METRGFEVRTAHSVAEGLELIRQKAPAFAVVDMRLEDGNGLDVIAALSELRPQARTIVLTGYGNIATAVTAVKSGAFDYLSKPFNPREMLARIRAVLRRQEMGRIARARDPERGGYRFGNWRLERRGRRLFDADDKHVPLSKGEYALLLAFLESPQRPLSREFLLQATRIHEDIFDRSIDVQVLRLRRKLETDRSAPRVLLTERGVGYVFALPVEAY